jgi:hypothetical protein
MATGFGLVPTPAPRQTTQFKLAVDAVVMHVTVRKDRRTVRDLVAKDFVVEDSGVQQVPSVFDEADIPIDLSLIIEQTEQSAFLTNGFERQISDVRSLLRDSERLGIVAAGEEAVEILPLSKISRAIPVMTSRKSTYAADLDAIAGVMLRTRDRTRRQLIIAMSTNSEGLSVMSMERLSQIARASESRLDVLVTNGARTGTRTLQRLQVATPPYWDWSQDRRAVLWAHSKLPESQYFDAVDEDNRKRLVSIATLTGGGEIKLRGRDSIANSVKQVLDEARAGYVVVYSPRGVATQGWHPVTVKIARDGEFEVRTRAGYIR